MDRRTLYSDVDDTILMHNLSDYPEEQHVTVTCNGREFVGVPNVKNLNLLVKFYKLGYDIIIWSKTGASWAKAVGAALNLDQYVTHYLSKPDFILDDRDASQWMGPRCYRDAKSGNESA